MTPREEYQPVLMVPPRKDPFGIIHRPDGKPKGGALLVHPFAEEKKFSYRVLVNLARELARRGCVVMRFDLSGCGDSPGELIEQTLDDWIDDIGSAANTLTMFTDGTPVTFLGLRLGATLALAAQADNSWARRLVLWEPILSGKKYIDEVLRRRMIKEMMTTGQKATGREQVLSQLETDGFLDLDGIAVGRPLIESIAQMDATPLAVDALKRRREMNHDTTDALLVQVAFNARVSSALDELAEKMRESGANVETIGVREQGFWDRVEGVEAKELINITCDWIAK